MTKLFYHFIFVYWTVFEYKHSWLFINSVTECAVRVSKLYCNIRYRFRLFNHVWTTFWIISLLFKILKNNSFGSFQLKVFLIATHLMKVKRDSFAFETSRCWNRKPHVFWWPNCTPFCANNTHPRGSIELNLKGLKKGRFILFFYVFACLGSLKTSISSNYLIRV